jgi:hypothetical protein
MAGEMGGAHLNMSGLLEEMSVLCRSHPLRGDDSNKGLLSASVIEPWLLRRNASVVLGIGLITWSVIGWS